MKIYMSEGLGATVEEYCRVNGSISILPPPKAMRLNPRHTGACICVHTLCQLCLPRDYFEPDGIFSRPLQYLLTGLLSKPSRGEHPPLTVPFAGLPRFMKWNKKR
jgi:hypothetical protein